MALSELESKTSKDYTFYGEGYKLFAHHLKSSDKITINYNTFPLREVLSIKKRINKLCLRHIKYEPPRVDIDKSMGCPKKLGTPGEDFNSTLDNLLSTFYGNHDDTEGVCCPTMFKNRNKFYEDLSKKFNNPTTDNYEGIMYHNIFNVQMFINGMYISKCSPGFIQPELAKGIISNIHVLYETMCPLCVYLTLCLLIYETTPLTKFVNSLESFGLSFAKFKILQEHSAIPFHSYIEDGYTDHLYLYTLLISENTAWYKVFIKKLNTNYIKYDGDFRKYSCPNTRYIGMNKTLFLKNKLFTSKHSEDMIIEELFLELSSRMPINLIYAKIVLSIAQYKDVREINISKLHDAITNNVFTRTEKGFANIIHSAHLKYRIHMLTYLQLSTENNVIICSTDKATKTVKRIEDN